MNILRYVGAHNVHSFKNDGQMEISNFPRFLVKMFNYSILDHIYTTIIGMLVRTASLERGASVAASAVAKC